jgi:TolA-binding protein
MAIEHGAGSFQITPANNRHWQIDVGPFLVTVKGTAFTVSWDATTGKFELKLRHGRVAVSGPVTGGEIALRAGQRLLVDLPQGETVISEQKPDEWIESPTGAAERGAQPPAEESSEAPGTAAGHEGKLGSTPPAGKLEGDRGWALALAAGHLDRILSEAERAGVKATLDSASSADLLSLADAARYRRRMDLAREALLAQRRRFPDSPRSLDTAFLLGRVEEATDRGLARAIEWYDEYLRRAPTGTYASEALGRKMTLMSKLGGASRARPVAEEYLRRFPNGTYAGPARAFVLAP